MYIGDKKDLVDKIRLNTFLENIYGVGKRRRHILLKIYGINMKNRMKFLLKGSLYRKMISFIDDNYVTETSLIRLRIGYLNKKKRINSLSGWRMCQGLPVRGQRTHTNASTASKLKMEYHRLTKKERVKNVENRMRQGGKNRRKELRKFFKGLKSKEARKTKKAKKKRR